MELRRGLNAASIAAEMDKIEVLHYLELRGADLSMPAGPYLLTPLMMATNQWQVRIVEYLTERMVDPGVVDKFGFTARDKARMKNLNRIHAIIEQHETDFQDSKRVKEAKKRLKEEQKYLEYDKIKVRIVKNSHYVEKDPSSIL